jgi:hypothetical protein
MLQWFMSKPPTLRYYFYPHKIEAAPIFSILIVFLICFFLCISVNLNTLILAALSLLYFFFFALHILCFFLSPLMVNTIGSLYTEAKLKFQGFYIMKNAIFLLDQ